MERSQVLDAMGQLKLYGMKAAYDEIIATAVKRQHEPQRIIGDLLLAEISEKQARSIKYQMTIAKLPLAKDIDDFDFDAAAVNETLVRDLAGGGFLEQQRNVVLIGGTGTGKSHAAIAIARVREADEALAGGADVLLVDNMSIEDIREAVRRAAGRVKVEISGGVTLDRMPELAASGADYVSVGALTHSAPAADLSFELQPA